MVMEIGGNTGVKFPDGNTQEKSFAALYSGRNLIRNGAMNVDQRATAVGFTNSTGSGAVYGPDGWNFVFSVTAAANMSRITTDAPQGFSSSLRFFVSSARPTLQSTNYVTIEQYIEGSDCIEASFGTTSARKLAIQFFFKTSVIGKYTVSVRNANNTRSYVFPINVTSANTWEKYTKVIPGDVSGVWNKTNGRGLSFAITLASGTNFQTTEENSWVSGNFVSVQDQVNFLATASSTAYLTGVQVEVSDTPTIFERIPLSQEIVRSERYLEYGSAKVYASANTTATVGVNYRSVKRVAPTLTFLTATGRNFVPGATEWNETTSFGVNRFGNSEIAFLYVASAEL